MGMSRHTAETIEIPRRPPRRDAWDDYVRENGFGNPIHEMYKRWANAYPDHLREIARRRRSRSY